MFHQVFDLLCRPGFDLMVILISAVLYVEVSIRIKEKESNHHE